MHAITDIGSQTCEQHPYCSLSIVSVTFTQNVNKYRKFTAILSIMVRGELTSPSSLF